MNKISAHSDYYGYGKKNAKKQYRIQYFHLQKPPIRAIRRGEILKLAMYFTCFNHTHDKQYKKKF